MYKKGQQIQTIGIESGLAGNHEACSKGPVTLRNSKYLHTQCRKRGIDLHWLPLLKASHSLNKQAAIKKLCREAELVSANCTKNKMPFLFFCGEHAYAMGIWKGAMAALASNQTPAKKLGLIWIDAHMDAHTFITSPSGNVHGMPVAALLGKGDERLNDIYGEGPMLEPKNLALLGLRSYEKKEVDLLKHLNVRHISMGNIKCQSLSVLLCTLREQVLEHADYFAISLDVDAIDPKDAPAVGVPEAGGLSGLELCEAFKQFNKDPLLLGVEIAEYSPDFDQNNKTLHLISDLVVALFGQQY